MSTLTGRNWTDSLALVQCERQPRAEAAFQRMAMAKCSLEHPGPSSSLGRRVSQLKKKPHSTGIIVTQTLHRSVLEPGAY